MQTKGEVLTPGMFKSAAMTPLQQQVYERGMCAQCHAKTLRFRSAGDGMAFWQCLKCNTIVILEQR